MLTLANSIFNIISLAFVRPHSLSSLSITYWLVTQALARPNDLIYLAINIIATKRTPLSLVSYILQITHTLTFSLCSLRKLVPRDPQRAQTPPTRARSARQRHRDVRPARAPVRARRHQEACRPGDQGGQNDE